MPVLLNQVCKNSEQFSLYKQFDGLHISMPTYIKGQGIIRI